MNTESSANNSPKQTFLIMKIIAAVLLAVLLAILTLHSNLHENIFGSKLHSNMLDLSPVATRPTAYDFQFQLPNLKAESISGQRGQVLHLNFWAKWCEACMRELPAIEKLNTELGPSIIRKTAYYRSILINLDSGAKAQAEAKKTQMQLVPSSANNYLSGKELAQAMNVEVLPYHILIDKSGRVAAAFYAPLDKKLPEFKRLILQLLAEEAPGDSPH